MSYELKDYQILNREAWQELAEKYKEPAKKAWKSDDPHWGIWHIPESKPVNFTLFFSSFHFHKIFHLFFVYQFTDIFYFIDVKNTKKMIKFVLKNRS